MKKLITERMVRQAWQDGLKTIKAPRAETIVTPEARGLARDLSIKLLEEEAPAPCCAPDAGVDEVAVRAIVERVVERLPQLANQPEMIRKVVLEVIRRYEK